ncbi:GNAT family N-acetyltransferase [Streptomyces sp. NPDC057718]|uniref:GNAT family N-acetyltransferase n=1 Tax=Streptomyces sp. NPDC057718 TaxID=3346225 RepID=UPI00368ED871
MTTTTGAQPGADAYEYEIDTDPDRVDIDLVHHWLSTDAFWALGRSRDLVERALRGSLNFGVYDGEGTQVAYARVVTDHATFAWLCDVYVDPAHRGRGLGVRLATAVRDHLAPYELKRTLLATLDAHELYGKVGFVPLPDPERLMVLRPTT